MRVLRRAVLTLVAVLAVLGMHTAVMPMGASAAPGMTATVAAAMASTVDGGDVARESRSASAPGHPDGSLPGQPHHGPMPAACAAILTALGLFVVLAQVWWRRSALLAAVAGPSVMARARGGHRPARAPLAVRLCVSRT